MACEKCGYKGIIIDTYLANAKEQEIVRVCPYCNDMEAYSNYIKQKYGKKQDVATVKSEAINGASIISVDFKNRKRMETPK